MRRVRSAARQRLTVMATVVTSDERGDLLDKFPGLVDAHDQLVRSEFDALIADVWGGANHSPSERGPQGVCAPHVARQMKVMCRTPIAGHAAS
jgi:hypothetical protein